MRFVVALALVLPRESDQCSRRERVMGRVGLVKGDLCLQGSSSCRAVCVVQLIFVYKEVVVVERFCVRSTV